MASCLLRKNPCPLSLTFFPVQAAKHGNLSSWTWGYFLLWHLVRWLFSRMYSWLPHSFIAQDEAYVCWWDKCWLKEGSASGLVSYETRFTYTMVWQTLSASGWLKYMLLQGIWVRNTHNYKVLTVVASSVFPRWTFPLHAPPQVIFEFFFQNLKKNVQLHKNVFNVFFFQNTKNPLCFYQLKQAWHSSNTLWCVCSSFYLPASCGAAQNYYCGSVITRKPSDLPWRYSSSRIPPCYSAEGATG